jgi:GntR family transcriptional regulator
MPARTREPTKTKPVRRARVTPLYHQVYVHLRQMLLEGTWTPEQPLPSEPALASRFEVSRITVRRTLEQLEAEGLIRRVRGVGTFPVGAPAPSARANISGILENLISYEASTTAINLEWGFVAPQGEAARALGADTCLRVVRVRRYQGQPISLTTIHIPKTHAALLKSTHSADEPIIRVLERGGIIAERAEQTITAVQASPLAAEHLDVPAGTPLICMRRLMLDRELVPVLHQESLYAPNRFEYRMTLTRTNVGPQARWTPIA